MFIRHSLKHIIVTLTIFLNFLLPISALATSFTIEPLSFSIEPGQGGITKWSIINDPTDHLTFSTTYKEIKIPGAPWVFYSFPDDQHPLASQPTPGEEIKNKTFFMFTSTDKVKAGENYWVDFTINFELFQLKPGAQKPWEKADYISIDKYSKDYKVNISIVPEPSTLLLLGSGVVGLVVLGRKRLFKKA